MSMSEGVNTMRSHRFPAARMLWLAVALGALTPALGAAQEGSSALYTADSGEVSRAAVVELPPAENNQGVVALSSATSAEDIMQPVLEIERGKTTLLKPSYAVKRIAVGDPSILDFVVNGSNEIQLVAKGVGNTNVLIWDSANRLQASIDIHVGAVRAQIVREIQRVLGRNDVTVDMAGEAVVLRGTVPNLEASEAAERVAAAFFTNEDAQGEQTAQPKVINMITVGGNHQVMIEVVIAEMSRGVSRALKFEPSAAFIDGNDVTNISSFVRNLTTPTTISNDIKLVGNLVSGGDYNLSLFLEALESERLGSPRTGRSESPR